MNPWLRISEIMSVRLVTTTPRTSLAEAAAMMRSNGVGSVLVTEGPRLLGIVTERDLVASVADRRDPAAPVEQVMTRNVITADPESDVVYAARLMADRGIRHLPVAQEDRPIGMVSIRDIVRWGLMALAWDTGADAREAFEILGGGPRNGAGTAARG